MSSTKAFEASTMVHQDRKGRKEALISITPRRPRRFLHFIILSGIKCLTGEGGRKGGKSDEKMFFVFSMWQVKPKLGNDMEVRIPSGKAINFEKSSGGKEEESRLRKLDTSIEMSGKNCGEEKSLPCLTRAEFQRRKAYFETEEKGKEVRERKLKWPKGGEEKKRSESFWRRYRSLESLSSSLECRTKELEMSKKLREIHELVQKMEKVAKMDERTKITGKAFLEQRNETKAPKQDEKWSPKPPKFESRCNLNRKLVPIQFSTSFVTELGSSQKSFSEKIFFKSVFIPSGDEEEERRRGEGFSGRRLQCFGDRKRK